MCDTCVKLLTMTETQWNQISEIVQSVVPASDVWTLNTMAEGENPTFKHIATSLNNDFAKMKFYITIASYILQNTYCILKTIGFCSS